MESRVRTRSGAPYRLSPNALLENLMITSGTMTNRIDQLERAGLVERQLNPSDRRSVWISLTARGLALAGWVANIIDPKTSRLEENLATLAERLPAPCLGRVPKLKHAGAEAVAEYLQLDLLD